MEAGLGRKPGALAAEGVQSGGWTEPVLGGRQGSYSSDPQPRRHQGPVCGRHCFHGPEARGGFGVIHVPYADCALLSNLMPPPI